MANLQDRALRLGRQKELLEGLLALSEEQCDCLIKGRAARLAEIVGEQTALAYKFSKLEALAESEEEAAGAEPVEPETREAESVRAEIKELAGRVRVQVRVNEKLARASMRFVDFSIGLLGGRSEGPSYSSTGRHHMRPSVAIMNKTA